MSEKDLNVLEHYVVQAEKRLREMKKIINMFRMYNRLKGDKK